MNSKEIEQVFTANKSDIESFQRKLLVGTLKEIITNTPAYKEHSELIDNLDASNVIETLRKIPTLTKQEVLDNPDDYHRIDLSGRKYEVRTGGTSGEILSFSRIRSEYDIVRSHIRYCWSTAGIELGKDRGVVLTARAHRLSKNGISFIDKNDILWIGCHQQTKEHWMKVYDVLIEHKPTYIRGFGSSVGEFFKFVNTNNLRIPKSISAVFYSSDVMSDSEKELIKDKYCDDLLSLYGQTERVLMGITCSEGNKFHLLPTYGFAEIVREDGSLIEEPGEIGYIVGTSLYPRSCSFVRYHTGDMGSWADNECKCGIQGPAISYFLQRSHEMITNKFGENINIGRRKSFLDFRDSLPIGTGIQFRQQTEGDLHVFIQTKDKKFELFENAFIHLQNEFNTSFEFIDKPILNKNGKRTLFVK